MKIKNNQTRWLLSVVATVVLSTVFVHVADAQTPIPGTEPAAEPPTPAAVANMANNCFTCHGPDGRSPGTIPSFRSMNAKQIAHALKEFKTGARFATVMTRHTKGYSDAELEAIANFIDANLK